MNYANNFGVLANGHHGVLMETGQDYVRQFREVFVGDPSFWETAKYFVVDPQRSCFEAEHDKAYFV